MLSNRQTAALKAFGKIEGYKNDLIILGSTLDGLPLWLPATALKKQCDEAIRMIMKKPEDLILPAKDEAEWNELRLRARGIEIGELL